MAPHVRLSRGRVPDAPTVTGLNVDTWRKRLSGAEDERSWWRYDAIDDADADALLTAIGQPELLAELAAPALGLRCEDCGNQIKDGDHRPLDLMRPDPSAQKDVLWNRTTQKLVRQPGKAKAGGRRFRIYDLCRRCAAEALRQRAAAGLAASTRDRVPPRRGGRPRLVNDHELRDLHLIYERTGRSIGDLARGLHDSRSIGSPTGYYQSILYGWRRLGLPLRPRSEQLALSHHLRGRIPRRPERCPATTRRGTPCELFVKLGTGRCVVHQNAQAIAA